MAQDRQVAGPGDYEVLSAHGIGGAGTILYMAKFRRPTEKRLASIPCLR